MNSESLARTLDEFLSEASVAVVLEDAAVLFDLAQAKYSIFGRAQQVPAASVVGGAEYCAACARMTSSLVRIVLACCI